MYLSIEAGNTSRNQIGAEVLKTLYVNFILVTIKRIFRQINFGTCKKRLRISRGEKCSEEELDHDLRACTFSFAKSANDRGLLFVLTITGFIYNPVRISFLGSCFLMFTFLLDKYLILKVAWPSDIKAISYGSEFYRILFVGSLGLVFNAGFVGYTCDYLINYYFWLKITFLIIVGGATLWLVLGHNGVWDKLEERALMKPMSYKKMMSEFRSTYRAAYPFEDVKSLQTFELTDMKGKKK
jgi:hypothetical protein